MFMKAPEIEIGQVTIATTEYKGHDPEYWAEQATNRIVSVIVYKCPIRGYGAAGEGQIAEIT